MKKLLLILMTIMLTSAICSAQYDPPTGYTTNYRLRMWDEGDRPGADSVNQNLKDIDNILKNQVMHLSGNESISGIKIFGGRTILTGGTAVNTGNHFLNRNDFMNEAPYSNYLPVNSAQLANKYYVDNSISTAGATYVHLTGDEVIAGEKTFLNATTIFGGSEIGDVSINMSATDNAKLQFNGVTFLTWNAATLTVPGIVNATGYQLNGVTQYLASAYGTKVSSLLYASPDYGGSTTVQINMVPVRINGVQYNLLVKE